MVLVVSAISSVCSVPLRYVSIAVSAISSVCVGSGRVVNEVCSKLQLVVRVVFPTYIEGMIFYCFSLPHTLPHPTSLPPSLPPSLSPPQHTHTHLSPFLVQDTTRTFSNIIVFIPRAKSHFLPRSYQHDMVRPAAVAAVEDMYTTTCVYAPWLVGLCAPPSSIISPSKPLPSR